MGNLFPNKRAGKCIPILDICIYLLLGCRYISLYEEGKNISIRVKVHKNEDINIL